MMERGTKRNQRWVPIMDWSKLSVSYQVWALGNWFVLPHFSMVNSCGPLLPYKARNPFIGTRDVPVTNCRSRALISLFREYTAYKILHPKLSISFKFTIKILIMIVLLVNVHALVYTVCIFHPCSSNANANTISR